jgi:SAM-dependent methyltransferase
MVRPAELIGHFEHTWKQYDAWYDAHPALYATELAALERAVPRGTGLEIGVGTGRFAAPLSVRFGLDPSFNMLGPARRRGVTVVQGLGEALPFKPGSFDFALIVFVLEFVEDHGRFLEEAVRVLGRGGSLVIGIIDRDTAWGRYFVEKTALGPFFNPPSLRDLLGILESLGLEPGETSQTLFGPPPGLPAVEEPRSGFGDGGFAVIKALKACRQHEDPAGQTGP